MTFKKFKKDFFYFRQAVFTYKAGWRYLVNRYFKAPHIHTFKPLQFSSKEDNLSIHVLSGKEDFTMLLWSLMSFIKAMQIGGPIHIHSDGTLEAKHSEAVKRLLPDARIITPDKASKAIEQLDNKHVIKENYPLVRQFFLLKKLFDPYILSDTDYVLVIDSDLAWFSQAVEIKNHINDSRTDSLMMVGNKKRPSYVTFKDGSRLKDTLATYNSGVVLYKKEKFNLELLDRYLSNIDLDDYQNAHFIEQAAYASCLEDISLLPEDRYFVKGSTMTGAVMKHYTSPRRSQFFIEAIPKLQEVIYG